MSLGLSSHRLYAALDNIIATNEWSPGLCHLLICTVLFWHTCIFLGGESKISLNCSLLNHRYLIIIFHLWYFQHSSVRIIGTHFLTPTVFVGSMIFSYILEITDLPTSSNRTAEPWNVREHPVFNNVDLGFSPATCRHPVPRVPSQPQLYPEGCLV